ncbi:MAG: indolepyruvate ferredoxin oxidoreductase subunit alpha [Candidatus Lokiarchaeota archaeon]|nr:indolepyruvate ferredoxin oxidoreductase subunit alpha [Candidatus Lokiarchaeota archaeon]
MTEFFSANPEKHAKMLVSGNEAIARAILESGVGFGSTYPGTPVSDVGDILHQYSQTEDGDHFIFDYALNEKVALEEAIGASWMGIRSVVIFKHLGMNVASDALHTIMYSGIGKKTQGGGLVLIVGGDPQASSSTNAEDVRLYAYHTHLPIVFPSSVEECHIFTKLALKISEQLGIPVMLYTTPKLSFMSGVINIDKIPEKIPIKQDPPAFKRDFEQFVNARHFALMNKHKLKLAIEDLQNQPILHDSVELVKSSNNSGLAIISGGYPYLILKDVLQTLELHEGVSLLKLNMVYPISPASILEFVKKSKPKEILVVEELEPMIETEVKKILYDSGKIIPVKGIWQFHKKFMPENLPGELTHSYIEIVLRNVFEKGTLKAVNTYQNTLEQIVRQIPQREPTFCPGCSHRNVFYALRQVADQIKKDHSLDLIFGGDIGCYTLGMSPPWSVMDWLICMGAGIGIANGVGKVLDTYQNKNQHVVALIGDSTFFHSGIQPLLNALKQNLNITLLVLNNYYVAMTGHQPSLSGCPGTEHPDAGFQGSQLRIEDFLRNLGTSQLHVVGGYDIPQMKKTFTNVFTQNYHGTRIVVVNAECALVEKKKAQIKWNKPRGPKRGEELYIQINESCPMCHKCYREFGCTAIRLTRKDGRLVYYIDESSCMREYCQACLDVCPNHCIEKTIINPEKGDK